MKLTQEQAGAALGVVLVIAAVLGIPYLAGAFVQWSPNPGDWQMGGRVFTVILALVLGVVYLVNLLPESEDDKPAPLFDDQTGERILR